MTVTTADFVDMTALLAMRARDQEGGRVELDLRGMVLSLRAVDALDDLWRRGIEGECRSPNCDRGAIFEEMLIAELLLRTWCSYLSLSVQNEPLQPQPARVVSSLVMTILTQRRRLLLALLNDQRLSQDQRRLDRTRRLIERWTDIVLAAFPRTQTVSTLCFDSERSQDFVSIWPKHRWNVTSHTEPVIVASMRSAVPSLEVVSSERAAAYQELLTAILRSVGGKAFPDRMMRSPSRRAGAHTAPRIKPSRHS